MRLAIYRTIERPNDWRPIACEHCTRWIASRDGIDRVGLCLRFNQRTTAEDFCGAFNPQWPTLESIHEKNEAQLARDCNSLASQVEDARTALRELTRIVAEDRAESFAEAQAYLEQRAIKEKSKP